MYSFHTNAKSANLFHLQPVIQINSFIVLPLNVHYTLRALCNTLLVQSFNTSRFAYLKKNFSSWCKTERRAPIY